MVDVHDAMEAPLESPSNSMGASRLADFATVDADSETQSALTDPVGFGSNPFV